MKPQTPEGEFRHQVLVVFRSVENRAQLLGAISAAGMVPRLSDSFEEGKRALEQGEVQVIVCEQCQSAEILQEMIRGGRSRITQVPVIVASRTGEWAEFVSALQQGACDYLALPPWPAEVRRILSRAIDVAARSAGHAGDSGEAESGYQCTTLSRCFVL